MIDRVGRSRFCRDSIVDVRSSAGIVCVGLLPVRVGAIRMPCGFESVDCTTVSLGGSVMRGAVVLVRLLVSEPCGLQSSLGSFDVGCGAGLACLWLRSAAG